tara:strand:- start:385 stop:816 length:432 start_codon:yes stop_codon:yes gene_type:complete
VAEPTLPKVHKAPVKREIIFRNWMRQQIHVGETALHRKDLANDRMQTVNNSRELTRHFEKEETLLTSLDQVIEAQMEMDPKEETLMSEGPRDVELTVHPVSHRPIQNFQTVSKKSRKQMRVMRTMATKVLVMAGDEDCGEILT